MHKKGFLLIVALMVLLGGALSLTPALAAGLTYQAEDATRGGGVNVVTTGTGFFGTGYVNFPASGGYVEFRNVDGGAGGRTLLRFRYKLGSTVFNLGRLTVNGANYGIAFGPTGSWTTWAIKDVVVTLTPGTSNTIRLASTGQYLANLDQLEIRFICSPDTTITVPYVFSGQGTYCWQTDDPGDAINSWNLARLTINGVDITNRWVGSSSYPPAINGFWYIDYTGDYPWSHIEVR